MSTGFNKFEITIKLETTGTYTETEINEAILAALQGAGVPQGRANIVAHGVEELGVAGIIVPKMEW